jgi:hypothetical protein
VQKLESEDVKDAPADGIYVHGLYLEGASWSKKESHLVEAARGELVLCQHASARQPLTVSQDLVHSPLNMTIAAATINNITRNGPASPRQAQMQLHQSASQPTLIFSQAPAHTSTLPSPSPPFLQVKLLPVMYITGVLKSQKKLDYQAGRSGRRVETVLRDGMTAMGRRVTETLK